MPLTCQHPRRIVYVHVPKTGGTQSRAVLRKVGKARKFGAGHDSIRAVPLHIRHRALCVATLRDPWTWYASWYEHAHQVLGAPGRDALTMWGNGADDFASVLYGITHPDEVTQVPSAPGVLFDQRNHPAPRGGLFSWLWGYFCAEQDGSDAVDAVIDTAQLTEGWSQVLGVDVEPGRANERRGGALPARYDRAFTSEMIGWVEDADAAIIERFGFKPFAPMSQPVTYLRDAPGVTHEQ